jgi:zinc protease
VTLPFTKHTLDNGLDVLLHQDRACPIVAVNLWYHVGSKNEQPGHTGFAHLFEHLMFEGSEHYDRGYFQPLQGAGATLNGSTNADRTNYWEVVPSNALELALWMESDRMGYLLPALTEAKFSNQRDVVLNERRQNYENRPYGLAPMALLGALFPPDHPYHWTTIGDIADLNAAQLEEVQAFFRRYYHPANASIAVAGDIDSDDALRLVRAYFEDLDAGEPVTPVKAAATLPSDTRIYFEDRVELPRLYIAWLTPAMFADGDADLDLGTDLLANGKTSRLYRRLVFEERIATDVSAAQNSREIAGYAQITATAAPGHTLREIEQVVLEEVSRLAAEGPTDDEIDRGRVQAEAQFMYRLQTVGGFGGKSDQLNAYNVFLRDPAYFDRDMARYHNVTRESLGQTISKYLDPSRRVTLSIVPRGRASLAAADSQLTDVS